MSESDQSLRSPSEIRVVIVDDQPLVRSGISFIISTEPGMNVVSEAANGELALVAVESHSPDIVLMDIRMPVMDGLSMAAAIKDAGISPDQIGYVNAHGTATAEGDPIEISALKQVFGDLASGLPVSATKSMHGHLLGAAGAIEAVVTILALREQAIPPTAHLAGGGIDPACEGVDHVISGRKNVPLKAALSNSFAFGGSNAVLAFRAALASNQ